MLGKLSQRGDTIIEVLVAIATVSAVLGAAYVSANRSLQASRQSQERGEAIRVVESQAEQIKVLARDTSSGVFDSANVFCIAFSGPNASKKQNLGSTGPFGATLESDTFSSYDPTCKEGLYNVGIRYAAPTAPGRLDDSFTIVARWSRLGGTNDEIRMVYRLH